MNKVLISMVVAGSVLLGGCQMRNEDAGIILGGALGGLVGSQIGSGTGQLAAVAAGALLGGLVGGNVGRTMDDFDRQRTSQTLEGYRTGETSSWENPDSGTQYAVTPTKTYESDGTPCREFTTEVWIDGNREIIHGTACRQADGTWQTI